MSKNLFNCRTLTCVEVMIVFLRADGSPHHTEMARIVGFPTNWVPRKAINYLDDSFIFYDDGSTEIAGLVNLSNIRLKQAAIRRAYKLYVGKPEKPAYALADKYYYYAKKYIR